jgi:hypothetical protein
MDSRRPAPRRDNPCCNAAIPCYHVAIELQYSWSGKMRHEISQFDIPDRQLPAGSAQAGSRSDIGEAKITRTIFGRARVRVIRKQDKILRAWLLGTLAVTVIAVAAWQGWVALQHSKMFAVLPPLSERISVSPPVYQPATIAPAAPRSPGKGRPESVIQTEIDSLVSNPNGRPPRPLPLNNTQPMDATPVTAQPLVASKPLQVKPQPSPPIATNNGASAKQTTVTQSHSKPSAPVPHRQLFRHLLLRTPRQANQHRLPRLPNRRARRTLQHQCLQPTINWPIQPTPKLRSTPGELR